MTEKEFNKMMTDRARRYCTRTDTRRQEVIKGLKLLKSVQSNLIFHYNGKFSDKKMDTLFYHYDILQGALELLE